MDLENINKYSNVNCTLNRVYKIHDVSSLARYQEHTSVTQAERSWVRSLLYLIIFGPRRELSFVYFKQMIQNWMIGILLSLQLATIRFRVRAVGIQLRK